MESKTLKIKSLAILIGYDPQGNCVYSQALDLSEYYNGLHVWDVWRLRLRTCARMELQQSVEGLDWLVSFMPSGALRAVEISGLMPGASVEVFDNGIEVSTPDPFETLEGATAEAIAWLTEKR